MCTNIFLIIINMPSPFTILHLPWEGGNMSISVPGEVHIM